MPATLNYIWIGEPRIKAGGQDVIGPETVGQNFLKFASEAKHEANPIVFWCLEKHVKEYQDYFAQHGISLKVNAIEPYIKGCREDNVNSEEVLRIFNTFLGPGRNQTIDRIYLKDLFNNFLLATQGGYVMDTAVQTTLHAPVHFPEYSKFMFPYLEADGGKGCSDVWLQYAPPDNLARAKRALEYYLMHFKDVERIFSEVGYLPKYHNEMGKTSVSAMNLLMIKPSSIEDYPKPSELMTDDCGVWLFEASRFVNMPIFNAYKEYYSSHRLKRDHHYGAIHAHVFLGDVVKLKFDLDHGILPDSIIANPRAASETTLTLDYNANNETLLHVAARSSDEQAYRDCLELLLKKGADANRQHEFWMVNTKRKQIKTPLIYTLESKNEDAVKLLFKYAKPPVKLDTILNKETPLMTAIRCENAVRYLLLEEKANANQSFVSEAEINTPLAMAVHNRKEDIVRLLLVDGNADPNAPIKNMNLNIISKPPLHIALENNDVKLVQLLLDNKANPHAVAEYKRPPDEKYQVRAEEIQTSKECRALLNKALKKELEVKIHVPSSSTKSILTSTGVPSLQPTPNAAAPAPKAKNDSWFSLLTCYGDSALPEQTAAPTTENKTLSTTQKKSGAT